VVIPGKLLFVSEEIFGNRQCSPLPARFLGASAGFPPQPLSALEQTLVGIGHGTDHRPHDGIGAEASAALLHSYTYAHN